MFGSSGVPSGLRTYANVSFGAMPPFRGSFITGQMPYIGPSEPFGLRKRFAAKPFEKRLSSSLKVLMMGVPYFAPGRGGQKAPADVGQSGRAADKYVARENISARSRLPHGCARVDAGAAAR